jgi:hypothetical protein
MIPLYSHRVLMRKLESRPKLTMVNLYTIEFFLVLKIT